MNLSTIACRWINHISHNKAGFSARLKPEIIAWDDGIYFSITIVRFLLTIASRNYELRCCDDWNVTVSLIRLRVCVNCARQCRWCMRSNRVGELFVHNQRDILKVFDLKAFRRRSIENITSIATRTSSERHDTDDDDLVVVLSHY